jgi:hypothetical protein
MLLFQPREFFRALVPARHSRAWLWIAMLILAALALSAVQQTEAPAGEAAPPGILGPEVGPFEGGFPPEGAAPPASSTASPASTWMTGLKAAGAQVFQWIVLTLVLSEVSMFNGRAPRLSTNLQIAIWTSVPLALMAVVQLIFIAGGGSIGKAGLTGFLESWAVFESLNIYLRIFIHGVVSHLTLFWLWSLVLLYIGARQTLSGKRLVVLVVFAVWIVVLGVGSGVQSYQPSNTIETLPIETIVPDIESGEFMPDDVRRQEAPQDLQEVVVP